MVEDASREELRAFLRGKTYIETCDHCNGRSYADPEIVPGIQTKVPLKYKRFDLVSM